MRNFVLLSTVLGAVAMTGCASSGSSSNVPAIAPKALVAGEAKTTVVSKLAFGGEAYAGTTLNNVRFQNVASDNIDALVVNGRRYDLTVAKSNRSTGFLGQDANRLDIAVSNHLSNAKYGWVHDETTDLQSTFYQGYMTDVSAVPTTGTATYIGHTVGACTRCDNQLHFGNIRLTANFGQKSIDGSFAALNQTFKLNATINGNKFSGIQNGTKMDGAFFGGNAQEVSGVIANEGVGFAGAFGATKQ